MILNSFAVFCLLLGTTVYSGYSQSLDSTTLVKATNSQTKAQTKLRDKILAYTQPGKKLDFFTSIKGREYNGVQIKQGVYTTLGHVALYKWGRAVQEMGVSTLEEAYSIFAEFKGSELEIKELTFIRLGFNKED